MRTTVKLLSPCALAIIPFVTVGCGAAPGDDSEVGTTSQASTVAEMRGVDTAGAFSASAARILKNDYGVRWTGVYIGGPCDGGFGWDKSVVDAIYSATGWSFLPIYVGQESSSICGAHNLTTAQGESDGHNAAAIMPSFGWAKDKNIPVTLDVEQATYEGDPGGTIDYVRGWLSAVKSDGYLPYVYSNPDAINAFASAHLAIDAVWVASYFYSGFESVTPYDLNQIGNNFSNHDRAWQYAGNVDIPGVGAIDCDQADFLLAPAPGGTNGPPPPPPPPPKPCSLGGKSYPANTCSETKQCDNGSWVARSSDASNCATGIEPGGACVTDSGSVDAQNTCTSTLQCDDGVWVDRATDPAACDCTLGGKSYATNTCTETKQCDDGSWVARSSDSSNCRTGIEASGACLTDTGAVEPMNTCTSTLQCDDGVWVDRATDPSNCR